MTPSPTGNERTIQRLIRDRMQGVAQTIESDLHGNLMLGVHTDKKRRVMLAGHCDQLGFMVKYISPGGYITLDSLGGNDYGVLLGEHVVIYGRNGPITGVVGRKPIHFQTAQEMSTIPSLNNIWLDIGAHSAEEVYEHVRVGDYATYRLGVTDLLGDRISSPALDNKAGLWVCLETMRRCAQEDVNVALYAVSTVQEEIGARGAETAAYELKPEIGIAVDTYQATDDPSGTAPQQQTPIQLNGGPAIVTGPNANPLVSHMLYESARRLNIRHQVCPVPKGTGDCANAIQTARGAIAAASVGIPQRSMHTQVEVCALDDIENSVRLLVDFIKSIGEDTNFRPIEFNAEPAPQPSSR
jgi:endoglucanase